MTAVCQSSVAVWEWVDWQISLTSVTLSLEVRLVHGNYIQRNFLEIELADAMLGGCSNLYTSNLNQIKEISFGQSATKWLMQITKAPTKLLLWKNCNFIKMIESFSKIHLCQTFFVLCVKLNKVYTLVVQNNSVWVPVFWRMQTQTSLWMVQRWRWWEEYSRHQTSVHDWHLDTIGLPSGLRI